jgi:hypothetical protein
MPARSLVAFDPGRKRRKEEERGAFCFILDARGGRR